MGYARDKRRRKIMKKSTILNTALIAALSAGAFVDVSAHREVERPTESVASKNHIKPERPESKIQESSVQVTEISKTELMDIKNSSNVILVNVLSASDLMIPGSTHVAFPGNDNFVKDVKAKVSDNLNKTVVVYCGSFECTLSTRAAQALIEAGFTDVLDYKGGLADWFSK